MTVTVVIRRRSGGSICIEIGLIESIQGRAHTKIGTNVGRNGRTGTKDVWLEAATDPVSPIVHGTTHFGHVMQIGCQEFRDGQPQTSSVREWERVLNQTVYREAIG